jgi:DNA-binding transcriptional regulator GbsR (MarR family)
MFRVILAERKKRETDPTLHMLRECTAEAKKSGSGGDAYTRDRLNDMLQFFDLMTTWYESTCKMPTPAVLKFVKMGDRVAKLLGITGG